MQAIPKETADSGGFGFTADIRPDEFLPRDDPVLPTTSSFSEVGGFGGVRGPDDLARKGGRGANGSFQFAVGCAMVQALHLSMPPPFIRQSLLLLIHGDQLTAVILHATNLLTLRDFLGDVSQ